MNELVKYVFSEEINDENENREEYVGKILNKLKEKKLIDKFLISSNDLSERKSALDSIDNAYYLVNFLSSNADMVNEYGDPLVHYEDFKVWNFKVRFSFFRKGDFRQMEVSISSSDYECSVGNDFIEYFKMKMLEMLSDDWNRIDLVLDRDSQERCVALYNDFHDIELSIRDLIYKLAALDNSQVKLSEYLKSIRRESKKVKPAPQFMKMDDELHSILMKDYSKVLKRHEILPSSNRIISKQFFKELDLLNAYRNYVMHNRFVDSKLYAEISAHIERVSDNCWEIKSVIGLNDLSDEERRMIENKGFFERSVGTHSQKNVYTKLTSDSILKSYQRILNNATSFLVSKDSEVITSKLTLSTKTQEVMILESKGETKTLIWNFLDLKLGPLEESMIQITVKSSDINKNDEESKYRFKNNTEIFRGDDAFTSGTYNLETALMIELL